MFGVVFKTLFKARHCTFITATSRIHISLLLLTKVEMNIEI